MVVEWDNLMNTFSIICLGDLKVEQVLENGITEMKSYQIASLPLSPVEK